MKLRRSSDVPPHVASVPAGLPAAHPGGLRLRRDIPRGERADLCPGMELRRAGLGTRRAGELHHPLHGRGVAHHPARQGRGAPRLLQRVPPSGHPSVRRRIGRAGGNHSVPLSRLDLRDRRPAHRRAAHAGSRRIRQDRDTRCTPPRSPSGKGFSSSIWRSGRCHLKRRGRRCWDASPGSILASLTAGSPGDLRRGGQLEAGLRELLRVSSLPDDPPRAVGRSALPERRQRPGGGPLPRWIHGDHRAQSRARP